MWRNVFARTGCSSARFLPPRRLIFFPERLLSFAEPLPCGRSNRNHSSRGTSPACLVFQQDVFAHDQESACGVPGSRGVHRGFQLRLERQQPLCRARVHQERQHHRDPQVMGHRRGLHRHREGVGCRRPQADKTQGRSRGTVRGHATDPHHPARGAAQGGTAVGAGDHPGRGAGGGRGQPAGHGRQGPGCAPDLRVGQPHERLPAPQPRRPAAALAHPQQGRVHPAPLGQCQQSGAQPVQLPPGVGVPDPGPGGRGPVPRHRQGQHSAHRPQQAGPPDRRGVPPDPAPRRILGEPARQGQGLAAGMLRHRPAPPRAV